MVDLSDLVGRPFVDGGRGPGFDCWGLVIEAFRRYGIALPDYPISALDAERIAEQIEQDLPAWRRCDPPYPVPAVVVLRIGEPMLWNHTGVYLGSGRFLHARARTLSCIERLDHPYWRRHTAGVYVPGWLT